MAQSMAKPSAQFTLRSFIEKTQSISIKNISGIENEIGVIPYHLKLLATLPGQEQWEVIMQSSFPESTMSPTWTIYGLQALESINKHTNSSEIRVAVYCGEQEVFQESFLLDEMFVLTPTVRSLFPTNFIYFQLGEIAITSERFAMSFQRLNPSVLSAVICFQDSEQFEETLAHHSNQSERSSPARPSANKKADVDSVNNTRVLPVQSMGVELMTQLTNQNIEEVQHLQTQHQYLSSECSVMTNHANQITNTRLTSLRQRIQQTRSLILSEQNIIEERKKSLVQVRFIIEGRQLRLLRDIFLVYPITLITAGGNGTAYSNNNNSSSNNLNSSSSGGGGGSGDLYAIRGIELPADLSLVKDDDSLASALGYIVHLLLLASKYLEVSLRYQLLFMGSRSLVRDPLVLSNTMTFPLFRKNTEKDRFDRAVAWLRADAEQLLLVAGLPFDPSKCLLGNLLMLAYCEECAHLAF